MQRVYLSWRKSPPAYRGLDEITGGGLPKGRPTLVRRLPLPLRKIIGDLFNKESVLVGLNLFPLEED